MSGGGRCARLERRMERAEMRKLGIGGQMQKVYRQRQLQQRRCREQEIVGERDDRADRAVRAGLVGIVAGTLLLCGFGASLWPGQGGGSSEVGIGQPGLNSRRGLDGDPEEMPE